jgi:cobalamin synthase
MFAFAAYASGIFGGINGDVLGFVIVVYEAVLYFTLAAVMSWGAAV